MANDSLSRGFSDIEARHRVDPVSPDYEAGDLKVNFFSNLKDTLGDTLWDTYQKTNTLTGGVLGEALEKSYYNIDANIKDYGLSLEKNSYMGDRKQDYQLTFSKRF